MRADLDTRSARPRYAHVVLLHRGDDVHVLRVFNGSRKVFQFLGEFASQRGIRYWQRKPGVMEDPGSKFFRVEVGNTEHSPYEIEVCRKPIE